MDRSLSHSKWATYTQTASGAIFGQTRRRLGAIFHALAGKQRNFIRLEEHQTEGQQPIANRDARRRTYHGLTRSPLRLLWTSPFASTTQLIQSGAQHGDVVEVLMQFLEFAVLPRPVQSLQNPSDVAHTSPQSSFLLASQTSGVSFEQRNNRPESCVNQIRRVWPEIPATSTSLPFLPGG